MRVGEYQLFTETEIVRLYCHHMSIVYEAVVESCEITSQSLPVLSQSVIAFPSHSILDRSVGKEGGKKAPLYEGAQKVCSRNNFRRTIS